MIDTLGDEPRSPGPQLRVDETFDRHRSTMPGRRLMSFLRATNPEVIVQAFMLSFGIIFVAELGDKSQLMALAFATRYPARSILIGIAVATAVVHAFSVIAGTLVGSAVPIDAVSIVAGVAFLVFAAWTLRGDTLDATEASRVDRSARSAVIATAVAFFMAELGDKTMLATMTLATTEGLFGTWVGSTLGMVAADGLAIAVGAQLGRRLPARVIRIGAAASFVVFALLLIVQGVR